MTAISDPKAYNARFTLSNLFSVEDWTCVVTGGGTGIGLMIAQAFANNGAKVYITSRRAHALDNAAETWGTALAHPKGALIPLQCDITDKSSIKALVEELEKRGEKSLDLLVNNAGISQGGSDIESGDDDAKKLSAELFGEDEKVWQDVYRSRSNVIGHFFIAAAFIPLLNAASTNPKRPEGFTASVINVSSM